MLSERTRRAQFFLGGRQARHVAPAILLGLAAGAAGGWNLSFALLLTLALWLNTPLVLLATSAVAGVALSLFCENLATTIGRALLDKCDLGSAFYAFAPGPTAALFGLDDYRLVGSLALGILVGVPAAHALSRLICRTPVGDDEAEPAAADPMLRPMGFVVASCSVGLATATVFVLGPQLVGVAALERLTAAVGAPVSVDRFDYDLWRGDLEITNLRVADARDGRTLFTARRIEGRVEPGLFLRGRLHAEEFAVGGVSFDLSAATRSEKAMALYARRPAALNDTGSLPAAPIDSAAEVEVQTMLRNVPKTNDRLAALAAAIGQVEWIADLEAPHTAGGKRLDILVRRKAAPPDVAGGRTAPLVKLKQVRIDGLAEFAELGPQTQLTLSNLTSRPSTAARHAQLTLADEGKFRLQTTFHLADPERQHAVTFELSDVAAKELVNTAAIEAIDVRDSRVEMVRGNGTATRDRFDLRLLVMARGVKASTSAGKTAGIDGDLLGQSLAKLPAVQLALKADGRWSQPRLSFSPPAALRDLKSLLRVNGAGELAGAIETGKRPAASAERLGAAGTESNTKPAAPEAVGTLAAGTAPLGTAPLGTAAVGTAPIGTAAAEPENAESKTAAAPSAAGGPATIYPAASKPLAGLVTGVATPTGAAPLAPAALVAANPAAASLSPASPAPASQANASQAPASVTPAQGTGLPGRTVAGNPSTNAANLAAKLGGAPLGGAPLGRAQAGSAQPGMRTPASVPAQTAGLRRLADGLPPMVQRTGHTVAGIPTGAAQGPVGIVPVDSDPIGAAKSEPTMALASDEFAPTGVAGPREAGEGPILSIDGLRQPTSVLPPAGTSGPRAMEAGPELIGPQNRTPTDGRRAETVPTRRPSSTLFDMPPGQRGQSPDRGSATDRSAVRGGPETNEHPSEGGPGARDLPTLPRRSLLTRDGNEPVPSGQTFDRGVPAFAGDSGAFDIPAAPKPEKKSLFSGIAKLFGKKDSPKVEHNGATRDDYLREQAQNASPPNTYLPDRRTVPGDRVAGPETVVEPEKKSESFPKLRSLFAGKPKPAVRSQEAPAEEPREERGLFGGSKNYDGGKVKGSKPKGRGIFGSLGGAAPVAAADEPDYAMPSGFVSDGETRGRVPTADYEAPVGLTRGAVPAGGIAPRATDLEPARNPERVSAGLPWYERMVR